MDVKQHLLDQERGFWDAAGDPEFYRANMADDGVCLLPVGALDKAETIEAIAQAEPWQGYDFDAIEVLELGDSVAMLTYRARGRREDQDDYDALVGTLYRNEAGNWKMLTHQQTPLWRG